MEGNKGKDWQIIVLLHDEASRHIAAFMQKHYTIKTGKIGKRYSHHSLKETLMRNIQDIYNKNNFNGNKSLILAGSGNMHHYTYPICKIFADKKSKGYGYIHFDLHDDTGKIDLLDDIHIGCASFVQYLLDEDKIKNVFYVGCCQEIDLPSFVWNTEKYSKKVKIVKYHSLENNESKIIMTSLKDIPNDVYVSMDLDVLERKDIHTGFGYGKLSLEKLIQCLEIIKSEKNIIGADVLGYETEKLMEKGTKTYKEIYEENKQKSLKTYKAIVDCLIG